MGFIALEFGLRHFEMLLLLSGFSALIEGEPSQDTNFRPAVLVCAQPAGTAYAAC
jgi:hypothetical protein